MRAASRRRYRAALARSSARLPLWSARMRYFTALPRLKDSSSQRVIASMPLAWAL